MLIGSAGADSSSFFDGDDAADDILRHAIFLNRNALGLEQLLQELPVTLFHLLNQVVDIGAVAFMQRAELIIEEVKFISLLERCVEHVHCHMKVECLVDLLFIIITC